MDINLKISKLQMLIFVFLFFCSCTTAPVRVATPMLPKEIPMEKESKPVQLKRVVVKIKRGTEIGGIQGGLLCVPQPSKLTWRGGRLDIDTDELTDVFREELESANYTVVGDPDALFDDPSAWKAEYLIGGLVTKLQTNMCYPNSGFGNWSYCKGELYMQVDWQVYSRLDRKVVLEISTEGSFKMPNACNSCELDIFNRAFGMATQNLLANEDFYNLMSGNIKTESNIAKVQLLKVPCIEMYSIPLSEHIDDIRAGTAMIFAGDGHGSGFFISADGYLVTAQHVVGEAKYVKVKNATGREFLGEVIAKDSRYDVALIKTEEKNLIPLAINRKPLSVGSNVYAVGSPLSEEFSTTVSKGIVSAYRNEHNINLIQSDVNVLPGNSGGPLVDDFGNVVGITSSGIVMQGSTTGLNFFIPIYEALNQLKVEIENKIN